MVFGSLLLVMSFWSLMTWLFLCLRLLCGRRLLFRVLVRCWRRLIGLWCGVGRSLLVSLVWRGRLTRVLEFYEMLARLWFLFLYSWLGGVAG